MKCLICGMIVNANSYNLNKHSFVDGNTDGNIIYCPFCGVGKLYLDSNNEIYEINRDNLDNNTKKVFDMAMKLEVFNGEFYDEASKLAKSDKVKNMFKDLSSIEFMHARIHKRLGGFSSLPKLRKPDYSRHDTDEKLMIEAYKREKHAIAFYKKYSDVVSNELIKEIFGALADVEKQHMIITKQ